MTYRPAPDPAQVAHLLAPIRAARRDRLETAIRAARAHDPAPTYAQIAEAANLSVGAVRAIVHGRRGAHNNDRSNPR